MSNLYSVQSFSFNDTLPSFFCTNANKGKIVNKKLIKLFKLFTTIFDGVCVCKCNKLNIMQRLINAQNCFLYILWKYMYLSCSHSPTIEGTQMTKREQQVKKCSNSLKHANYKWLITSISKSFIKVLTWLLFCSSVWFVHFPHLLLYAFSDRILLCRTLIFSYNRNTKVAKIRTGEKCKQRDISLDTKMWWCITDTALDL